MITRDDVALEINLDSNSRHLANPTGIPLPGIKVGNMQFPGLKV